MPDKKENQQSQDKEVDKKIKQEAQKEAQDKLEKDKKFKDTTTLQSYTDPFSKKQFWLVQGTTENIKRSDVFPIMKDPKYGRITYGTYSPPRQKGSIPEQYYLNTTLRQYDTGESKLIFPNEEMEQLYYNKSNPFANRQKLSDPSVMAYSYNDPSLTQKYYKQIVKVVPGEYNDGKIKTDNGVSWTQPGQTYYKIFDDGSKEKIDQVEYEKWIGFNNAPATVKRQVGLVPIETSSQLAVEE
jgi:hypothetical protein